MLIVGLLAASVQLAVVSGAEATPYRVLKCHFWHPDADEVDSAGNHSSYIAINDCNASASDRKLGIVNRGNAGNSAYKQWMFTARSGTKLDSVCLEYKLRRDNHHRAEILSYPGFAVLAAGGDGPSSWSPPHCYSLGGSSQVIVRLACSEPGGCLSSSLAHAYVRNIELRVSDSTRPVLFQPAGSLLEEGWLRGPQNLSGSGSDSGSGAFHLSATVNEQQTGMSTSSCGTGGLGWPYAIRLVPCPHDYPGLNLTLDTELAPFVNGANSLRIYGDDFAGNVSSITRTVLVDNLAPSVAFANQQELADPELIRAPVSDAHSGLESVQISFRPVGGDSWTPLATQIEGGEARAHVNSSSVPEGDYQFLAQAADVAGNTIETSLRQNGSPMQLTFPLRSKVQLQSRLGRGGGEYQTVRYGTPSSVHGRLLDPDGNPLADRRILVTEHFGDGALIRERPTEVVTNDLGRFSTKLPAGPSREVDVAFDGSAKYLPTKKVTGQLAVKSRATLRISRQSVPEGGNVSFLGRVAHFGARIPSGGKLLELQVRVKAGRWQTVRQAFHTRASGKYRLGYRFGKHYTQDARFRFRIKVENEGDWPFKGAKSRQRTLTVKAN